ncbi:MAG: hypothetical protein J6P98_02135 [Clostridia bacterium]|nr:hypothetical protein [Clostridia bacterium]
MGNPTGYMGLSLSWEGKQLVSAERTIGSITSAYSFSYDENGLRTRKTFTASFGGNSASVHTDYYYNGSVLIGIMN